MDCVVVPKVSSGELAGGMIPDVVGKLANSSWENLLHTSEFAHKHINALADIIVCITHPYSCFTRH